MARGGGALTPARAACYTAVDMAPERQPLRRSSPRLAKARPFAAIVGFGIALLYPLILLGRSLYWGDVFLYFYPLESYVRDRLRDGAIPLWNPYVLCGQPLVGNPQAWVFYPTTLLLPFMPVWLYFTVNSLIHLCLAGGGTYLLLRRLTHDRTAAILGGLTYMGSGFLMARLQFPTMIMAAAWLPWMLVLVDRVIDRPAVGYAALLALVVGLEILAAHTQLTYLSVVAAILYALARLWQIRGHRTRTLRAFGLMTAALILGTAAAMVYLLPALQLFGLSTREKLTWMQANRFVLLPEQLLNFVWPTFYGNPAHGDYWGEGNFWEPCVYLGVIPLLLALYAAFRAATRPATRFFAILGFVSLWLAMGRFGGIYFLAYYSVPGLASFHDPARFAFLATFSFACLASFGMRALRDRGLGQLSRTAAVVVAAVNLWAFSAHINPTIRPDAFDYRPRVIADTPKHGQGRVFTVFRDQVWKRYLNYDDYGPESARYADELTDTLAPNIGMRLDVEEGSGYEPVPLKSVTDLDGLTRVALERQATNLPNLLRLFNAQLLLLPEATRYRHPALQELDARGVTALAVTDPGARMWLVRSTMRVDGTQRTLSALASADMDTESTALVSGSPGLGDRFGPQPVADQGRVTVTGSGAHEVQAMVDAEVRPGFLVWSEAWYPGWRATVDGIPVRVERANHAFQGVVVPPGAHRIRFTYRPTAYRVGLYITLACFAVISAGMAFGLAARPTRHRNERAGRGFHGVSGVQSIP
jgi:hypothetical protein